MAAVRFAHTASLSAEELQAIRVLLYEAPSRGMSQTRTTSTLSAACMRRRRGHGASVMAALERVIRGAYELGALSTSEEGAAFYAARGWQLWAGTTSVIAPGGIVRTEEEEGGIYVLPVSAELTRGGDLACDWRGGDVW